MKKKILIMGLSFLLVAAMVVGGTLAYLTVTPDSLKNTVASVGDVDITLEEEVDVDGAGSVTENGNGATYTGVMPGDRLQKEVTIENVGANAAYVRVDVKLNNADKINAAIDDVYENAGYSKTQIQALYDYIFADWGINYNPRPGEYGDDARGVIDGTYGLPENVLHVDFSKTTKGSTVIGAGNWFIAGSEKAGQYWVDGPKDYDGYYTKAMDDYEICYAYYIYLEPGESTTLFSGLNVPAEFNKAQLAMFKGLTIDVNASAIQAENISTTAAPGTDEYAKAAFAILAGDVSDKTVYVSTTEALVEALKNADANSVLNIVLTADVEYVTDSHHGENNITPASAVIIDGQGKYTITATGAGVTPIGDDAASLTLKDLTVADKSVSYKENAWEFSYLEMGGTELVCTNVTFTDPIMVESDNATFTNCTFTGYEDTVNDIKMNGVWMYNGDATFTGCTFNGTRGMKICDQYDGEVGTVVIDNCTFNNLTQKPGVAIDDRDTEMNAKMNITIKNSTFINCQPGDQGLYVYESDNTKPTVENNKVVKAANVASNEELDDALKGGADTIVLSDGTYTLPDSARGKTLTINGTSGAVIKVENESGTAYANPSDGTGVDYSLDGSTVTFNGVTIDTTANGGTYPSFARLSAVYNNCTINGTYVLGTGTSEFNNCTLNVSGDAYNIWTWGAKNVKFDGCTFNCDGKSVLVYNQSTTVNVTNCTFNDKGGLVDEQKAAIETGSDSKAGATYNIYITKTTVNGFNTTEQKSITFGGTNLGTNVWGNKNLLDADHLNVYIDGTDVY